MVTGGIFNMLNMENLPMLGVGVSLSLQAHPRPLALLDGPHPPQFVEYAGRVSVEDVAADVDQLAARNIPVLFHPSFINFAGTFPNNATWLSEARRHLQRVKSPWFAQDCGYCFWGEHAGYSSQFGWFLPPVLNAASLMAAVERVREVQDAVGVPVAIEPPPFTFVAGTMPLGVWLGEVARAADCALLLDAGHLCSYARVVKNEAREVLQGLPLERVVEVHAAGGRLEETPGGTLYVDAHDQPILMETWDMLTMLLERCPQLRAVCFECEGQDAHAVATGLQRIKSLVVKHAACSALKARVSHGPA